MLFVYGTHCVNKIYCHVSNIHSMSCYSQLSISIGWWSSWRWDCWTCWWVFGALSWHWRLFNVYLLLCQRDDTWSQHLPFVLRKSNWGYNKEIRYLPRGKILLAPFSQLELNIPNTLCIGGCGVRLDCYHECTTASLPHIEAPQCYEYAVLQEETRNVMFRQRTFILSKEIHYK